MVAGVSIWKRMALCLTLAASGMLCGGCPEQKEPDKGANQSLVEIGERSLEQAEEQERGGKNTDAYLSYKRALWAFRYHEKLTGEEPFLLDDALEGVDRTSPGGGK